VTCAGWNHPFNCDCGFGERSAALSSTESVAYQSTPLRKSRCRKCGASVYYIASGGGGTLFDSVGPSWIRHPCTDQRFRYSPFNRLGKPKLRDRTSALKRRKFQPISVERVVCRDDLKEIYASWLANPSSFRFECDLTSRIDMRKPIFMRIERKGRAAKLNYVEEGSGRDVEVKVALTWA
jgi:hypothetical protein